MDHICPLLPMESDPASCKPLLKYKCYTVYKPITQWSQRTPRNSSSPEFVEGTCVMKVSKQCVVGQLHGEDTALRSMFVVPKLVS